MIVARKSPFTGNVHEMDIPLTEADQARLASGESVQKVVPHLSADQREFLISGITPAEWETYLGGGDE